MTSSQSIKDRDHSSDPAPTPQNTPLDTTAPINRPANLGKPKVEDIGEGDDEEDDGEDVSSMNPASLLAKNPALLALAQAKLGSLVGADSGYIASLPAPVRRRIDGLKGVQVAHSKIESEFQMAILELEKKFLVKFEPLYKRRADIIAGAIEPTDAEVEEGKAADSDDEDDDEEEGAKITEVDESGKDKGDAANGIPQFWLTALRNHTVISDTITDKDEAALEKLVDIKLSYLDGQPGFKIHFAFAINDYFSDSELTKTYYYQEQVGYGGDFVYDKAVGSDIKWKEGKDLTKTVEIKKQRNKSTGRTRVIKKEVNTDSFFNFFSPPKPPSPEFLEQQDVDEEQLEELDSRLELDYQLGEEFKEKVIPRAVDYFTGKALKYEADFEDEEDFEDDEDFEDEDDEDDEEAGEASAEAAPGKEECKQQ